MSAAPGVTSPTRERPSDASEQVVQMGVVKWQKGGRCSTERRAACTGDGGHPCVHCAVIVLDIVIINLLKAPKRSPWVVDTPKGVDGPPAVVIVIACIVPTYRPHRLHRTLPIMDHDIIIALMALSGPTWVSRGLGEDARYQIYIQGNLVNLRAI